MKSVCLFLSKKGHRKTFAKNKLSGRILACLGLSPSVGTAPSRGAGVSAAAANPAFGGPMPLHLAPLPH